MNYYLRKGSQGYYRPNSQGYTDKMTEAGLFTEARARNEVAETHGEVTMIPECPSEKGSFITVSDLSEVLEDAIIMGKDDLAYVNKLKDCRTYLRRHKNLEIRP